MGATRPSRVARQFTRRGARIPAPSGEAAVADDGIAAPSARRSFRAFFSYLSEDTGMQIEERVVNNVTVLDLKGKMTLGEGDELLKDKINSLLQQDRKQILLNLEGVPYIDSAGLGEIVRTYTTVSRQGGKLKLVNLTKRITDLLSITKLLTVFETFDSEPDAIRSFS
jgi:anti-sigma B factor antagonist